MSSFKTVLVLSLGIIQAVIGQQGSCPCEDIQADVEYTCEQQRKFGKCNEQYMIDKRFCDATCDRCPEECPYEPPEIDLSCGCTNNPPEGDFTCDDQKRFGSCTEDWMKAGNYCEASCERCVCVNGVKCTNIPPPGDILCLKQVEFGKCSEEWMISNRYCEVSCGTCPTQEQLEQAAESQQQDDPTPPPKQHASPPTVEIDADIAPPPVVEPVEDVSQETNATSIGEDDIAVMEPVVEEETQPKIQNRPRQHQPNKAQQNRSDTAKDEEVTVEVPVPEPVTEEAIPEVVPGESEEVLQTLVEILQRQDANSTQTQEETQECETTLYEVIASDPELSLLSGIIQDAGFESTLNNAQAQFTIFAPNNQAIEEFQSGNPEVSLGPSQMGLLQSILGYHIVNISYTTTDLAELPFVETLLGKETPLYIETVGGKITLEGESTSAQVVTPDKQVCKSVIHVIDSVLLATSDVVHEQPEEQAPGQNVTNSTECIKATVQQALTSIPEATTFLTVLEALNYDTFPSGPLTLFVPTAAAFESSLTLLGFSTLGDVVASEEAQSLMTSILTYHMVPGYFPSDRLQLGADITTLNSSTLSTEVTGGNLVVKAVGNMAQIVEADASVACDIAVHVVDAVLLPFSVNDIQGAEEVPSSDASTPTTNTVRLPVNTDDVDLAACDTLATVLGSRPELSLLVLTAEAARLEQVLDNPTQEITFFAPTNEAFRNLNALLGDSTVEIIQNEEYLNAVLAYHALDGAFTSANLVAGQEYPTLVQNTEGDYLTVTVRRARESLSVQGIGNSAKVVESDIVACKSVVHLVDTVLLPVQQA